MIKVNWEQKKTERQREHEDDQIKAQRYLKKTDWYISRAFEDGVPVPKEVSEKRRAAKATLNKEPPE